MSAAAALVIASVFARIHDLQQREFNQNAYAVSQLDKQCEALAPEVLKLGSGAAEPLFELAKDGSRPVKERLFAVSFLGLLEDPSTFLPLESLALSDAPDPLRSTALSALGAAGVGRQAVRRTVCQALSQDDLPPQTLAAALDVASRTGCDRPEVVYGWAKQLGRKPGKETGRLVTPAALALARSFPLEAARLLWRLFLFYPPGSPQRLEVLNALWEGRDSQRQLGHAALLRALDAAESEPPVVANVEAALRLAAFLDDGSAAPVVSHLLRSPYPKVAACAANALAGLRGRTASSARTSP